MDLDEQDAVVTSHLARLRELASALQSSSGAWGSMCVATASYSNNEAMIVDPIPAGQCSMQVVAEQAPVQCYRTACGRVLAQACGSSGRPAVGISQSCCAD